MKGCRILLVDLDPQGSISLTSGANTSKPNAYDLLTGKVNVQETIQQHTQYTDQQHIQQVDIIPASQSLSKLDIELKQIGKEYRLKEKIAPLVPYYHYIVIDTPPALGTIGINALTAADSLVIPAQADLYSLQGIGQLYDTVSAVRAYTNPGLSLKGVLLTRHNARSILSREMAVTAAQAATQIGTFLYKTFIREAVALKEAQASQKPIYVYAPKSNAAIDYSLFIDEFLERSF